MNATIPNNKRKKIIVWSIGIFAFLLTALVVHILISTQTVRNDDRVRQLSRIDFKEPVDSLTAIKIKNTINAMEGVDGSFFNIQQGTFVFIFYPKQQSTEAIFNKVMSLGNFKAERYMPSDANAAAGCPVMDKSSFLYRVGVYFSNLF